MSEHKRDFHTTDSRNHLEDKELGNVRSYFGLPRKSRRCPKRCSETLWYNHRKLPRGVYLPGSGARPSLIVSLQLPPD
ncbi:hypothetical protein VUR80DRAFT_2528 [Thermomyces stellatus]